MVVRLMISYDDCKDGLRVYYMGKSGDTPFEKVGKERVMFALWNSVAAHEANRPCKKCILTFGIARADHFI